MAKLGYVKIPNVINLSYSKFLTLHSCPRKFELQELEEFGTREETIPTAYGHAFGNGVQELFRSGDLGRAYFAAFMSWPFGFEPTGDKYRRTIGLCLEALRQFYEGPFQQFFAEWELMEDGIEHLFLLHIAEGFNYQGHIDIILKRRDAPVIATFEMKTTTKTVSDATYANSNQTGGYQVVVNEVAAQRGYINEGKVYYLVQNPQHVLDETKDFGFQILEFTKSKKTAVEFLQATLLDIRQIQMYKEARHFPKRGESCQAWGRNCHFFGLCGLESLHMFFNERVAYTDLDISAVNTVISVDDLMHQLSSLSANEELDLVTFD